MGIIENEKKILGVYIFFIFFPVAGNKKKIKIMKKKKIPGIVVFGLLPKNIVKFFFFCVAIQFCIAEKKAMRLYCKMGVLAWNCIAIQFTVLQEKAEKIVL